MVVMDGDVVASNVEHGEGDFRGTLDIFRAIYFVEEYRSRGSMAFQNMTCLHLDLTRPTFVDDINETWRYKCWETVGAAGMNMTSITTLSISFEERPDWEALACILRHLRRQIKLDVEGDYDCQREDVEHFARTIHGNPSIKSFETRDTFSVDCFDIIFSALSSLPVLEAATLWHREWEQEENPLIPHPQQMTEFLLAPSLRFVEFDFFYFTNALCQAMASALSAGSNISSLRLNSCIFPDGGISADIAHALQKNSSLRTFDCFDNDVDAEFFIALANSLAVNTALVELSFRLSHNDSSALMTPVFHAMARNVAIKTLVVDNFKLSDESLSAAICCGMGHNSTLEKLIFYDVASVDADSVPWREALSFLPVNTYLKALTITIGGQLFGQSLVDLCMDAIALLKSNTALVFLEIVNHGILPVDYFKALSLLKCNSTLKTLHLSCSLDHLSCSVEFEDGKGSETEQLLSAVKKNYGLESLGGCIEARVPTVGAVLRLNSAGRRYLVQDAASASKGCALLSAVSDDLDCVYFHLLENPSLCERREWTSKL
jgi:hypothetical protein